MAERQGAVEDLGELGGTMTNPIFDFYRGKRVLVTGHTGFKGSWLCEILLLAGAQVTGYSLNPPSDPSLFELLGLSERMDSRIGTCGIWRI